MRLENKVAFDFLLSWQHSCQKLSKSVDVCRSYSKPTDGDGGVMMMLDEHINIVI